MTNRPQNQLRTNRRVASLVLMAGLVVSGPSASAQEPTSIVPWADLLTIAATAPSDGAWAPKHTRAPRVFPILTPDASLGTLSLDLAIPVARQIGDKTNCGPTTAAMALAAFAGELDPKRVRALRDDVGEWSWQAFPLRQLRVPGYYAGMTTREMMRQSMDAFGAKADVGFEALEHPWLPLEAWSVIQLKRALLERRPVIVLAEAAPLWDMPQAIGLHWVVVRGMAGGRVTMNDPADGAIVEVPLERFWKAWRLSDLYRSLPMVAGFEALVPDRSLRLAPSTFVSLPHVRPDAMSPRRM